MSDNLNNAVKYLHLHGDLDHPDEKLIQDAVTRFGLDRMTAGKALFAAIDLKSLDEAERLDGGNGDETGKVEIDDLLKVTFSKGE